MTRRRLILTVFAGVLLVCAPTAAMAQEPDGPTGADVLGLAGPLPPADGSTVLFEAEAIGEALRAPGGMRWVNLGADGTAIGVVMTAEAADAIGVFGDYGHTGDVLRVEGTFQRACDEHGGDRDVHAQRVDILVPGSSRDHPIGWWKLGIAFGTAALGAVQIVRLRRRRPY